MGSGDPNLGPHICATNTLSAEPSPRPLSFCHLHLTLSSLEASCSGFLLALSPAATQARPPRKGTAHCELHPLGTGGGTERRAAKLVVSFELFNYSMFFLYQGLANRAGMFEGCLSVPRSTFLPSLSSSLRWHTPLLLCVQDTGRGPAATGLSVPLPIPLYQIPHLGV